MNKKIICFLCAVLIGAFFCFSNVQEAKADVAELIVEGGSLATGALGDLGSYLGPAGAAITALVLMAGGLDISINEDAAAQGLTRTQYMQNMMTYWCDSSNNPTSKVFSAICNGAKVAKDGVIFCIY